MLHVHMRYTYMNEYAIRFAVQTSMGGGGPNTENALTNIHAEDTTQNKTHNGFGRVVFVT